MMAQCRSNSNQIKDSEKNLPEMEVCEATYLIIDSVSTQYVESDVKNSNTQDMSVEDTKNSGIIQAINNIELAESTQKTDENIQTCAQNKGTVSTNKNPKTRVKKPFIPPVVPTSSRCRNIFNKVQEILEPQTDKMNRPVSNIAEQLKNHTKETYVELLCKIESSLQVKEVDGDIQVKVTNKILNIPIDHFHSYLHNENDVRCIVCHISIPKSDIDMHKYEVRHMNNLIKTVDCSGLRKVEFSYSHCVVCNIGFKSRKAANEHISTPQHKKATKLYSVKQVCQ